ncbi:MAG: FHA domain-containing protein [Bacteroidales bacterium]|nr:FHA domain-containing protein [Bacteroidales bacterium]
MKKYLFLLTMSMAFFACNQSSTDEKVNASDFLETYAQSPYKIEFTEMGWSTHADTISLKFKIVRNHEKEFWDDIRPREVKIVNDDISVKEVISLTNDKQNIPDDILVSLLIDRSIHPDDMEVVQEAVGYFVDSLPVNTVYVSFFDNRTESSQPITPATFDEFDTEFTATDNSKIIFDAALKKFRELAGEYDPSFNLDITDKAENDTIKKYLIILTDGKINANDPRTSESLQDFVDYVMEWDQENDDNTIEVHAIRYGEANPTVDDNLSFLCKDIRKDMVKGEFYTATQNDIFDKLKEFSDKISADYELVLVNTSERIYAGEPRTLMLQIEKNDKKALGKKEYVIGTLANPIDTKAGNISLKLILGLFWGLLAFFIVYFTIQVIVPFLIFKTSNFDKKYVKIHRPHDDELVKCSICMEDLIEGEEIVAKCQHLAHKYCWRENGYKCTEYGQNCKDGKQYYFDKDKPFSEVNRPYFMKWVLYGLIGGLLSWVAYQLILSSVPVVFEGLTGILLNNFYPAGDLADLGRVDYLSGFLSKVGEWLLVGLLLGFILSVLFSYVNEYRKKNVNVWLNIFLRGLLGSFAGFVSFLVGAIIIIICKSNGADPWVDWIPYLLFGGAMGLCLSIKTSIVWNHALLGGVISGLFSFFILFLSKLFGSYAVLFSYMLYSAGLGFSIVTIHYTAQKYFLKYKGQREGEIAIHKWMSVSGGSNDVTIGRSNQCIIQMNWDTHESIQDIHAKLYVDKKMKLPYIKVMEDNMSFNGSIVRKNSEFQLKQGISFKIGNTEFQYIEKL